MVYDSLEWVRDNMVTIALVVALLISESRCAMWRLRHDRVLRLYKRIKYVRDNYRNVIAGRPY